MLLLGLLGAGCERSESALPPVADAPDTARVVSLSPGVTATLAALGAEDLLVGRTPWCVGAPNTPAVGTLLDVDAEALVRAKPTVIFVQPAAQGIPSALVELAQAHGWSVVPIPLATLADCRRAVKDVSTVCMPLCSEERRLQMQREASRLGAAFDAAVAPLPGSAGKRVLAVVCGEEGADLLAFGTESYLMEVLQAQGFAPALERVGYQSLGNEDLLRTNPDIVILLGRQMTDARFDTPTAGGAKVVRLDEPALLQPGGGITESLLRMRSRLASEVQVP